MKYVLSFAFALMLGASTLFGQTNLKFAHVNVELILSYMPEYKTMGQQLQAQRKKYAEQLAIKENYGQQKLAEYLELAEVNPNSPDLKAKEDELRRLEAEIQKNASESERKLQVNQQKLLAPILEKMDKAIKAEAAASGYDYVFSDLDGNGTSVVLYAPEERNLTKKVMKRLGIEVPTN
ncbi:MAG: OmpH family outer membrane protein [Bacteroidota bacterium]